MRDYINITKLNNIKEKSYIIGCPYDSQLFNHSSRDVRNERGNEVNCVFVGRLSKGKNVQLAIESIKNLNNKNINFTICGEGEERSNLESLTTKLNLNQNIKFLGNVTRDELPGILEKSHIFLLPSLNEGSPVCISEALAMGNIVVSTDVGDVSEIVKDGVNGYIVKNFEVEEFSYAINKVINSDMEKMRVESLESVKRRSSEYISQKLYEYIICV